MLFAVIARFRRDAAAGREELHEQFGDHLAQHGMGLRIRLGGSLRDTGGARTGVMMLIEAAGPEAIARFLEASPYAAANLYETTSVDPIDLEVGSL